MKILATILLLCGLSFAQGTELLRPTVESGGSTSWTNTACGIASTLSSGAMPLAYDSSGLSTSSTIGINNTTSGASKVTARLFSSWAATSNSYSALTLNVSAKFSGNDGGGAGIVYSIDAGATYTKIATLTALQTTYPIVLSASQDLSKLRVGACAGAIGLDPGTGTGQIVVYDIWTSGTTGSAAVGNGSGSGTAVQPVQFN